MLSEDAFESQNLVISFVHTGALQHLLDSITAISFVDDRNSRRIYEYVLLLKTIIVNFF